MFNKIVIVGRLTKDAELVNYSKGQFARLRVAQSSKFKNKEENLFIDVLYFIRNIEPIKNRLSKGRLILVEGRLAQDKNNKINIIANNIIFLERATPSVLNKTETKEKEEKFEDIPEIPPDEEPF